MATALASWGLTSSLVAGKLKENMGQLADAYTKSIFGDSKTVFSLSQPCKRLAINISSSDDKINQKIHLNRQVSFFLIHSIYNNSATIIKINY